jgi:hypothetical protein
LNVDATGGSDAAGIGGGTGGNGGNVYISNSTVTAQGNNAKGIGAGNEGTDDGELKVDADVYVCSDNNSFSAITDVAPLQKDSNGYVTGVRKQYVKIFYGTKFWFFRIY